MRTRGARGFLLSRWSHGYGICLMAQNPGRHRKTADSSDWLSRPHYPMSGLRTSSWRSVARALRNNIVATVVNETLNKDFRFSLLRYCTKYFGLMILSHLLSSYGKTKWQQSVHNKKHGPRIDLRWTPDSFPQCKLCMDIIHAIIKSNGAIAFRINIVVIADSMLPNALTLLPCR